MKHFIKYLEGASKKLEQMQKEPASKEWFEKHGTPKHMKHNPLKEALLKRKAERSHVPSEREKEIKERNEHSRISNMKEVWKDRHQRRHHGGKRTSLAERHEWIKEMSKD